MHDRAADPIGAATSVTAATIEIMILLSIEVGIAQVRLPVEEKRSARLYSHSRASPRDGYDTFTPCAHPFRWQFLQAICNKGDYNSLLNHQKQL
jgi:hypothetical protein